MEKKWEEKDKIIDKVKSVVKNQTANAHQTALQMSVTIDRTPYYDDDEVCVSVSVCTHEPPVNII